MGIKEKVKELLYEIPSNVLLVAAIKKSTVSEIEEAISAGICAVGENYLQEAQEVFSKIGRKVEWHFIGYLQQRKLKKIVEIFDVVETVDSFETALEIDKQCKIIRKKMPLLIEVNSAREPQKTGVMPEEVERIVEQMSRLTSIKIEGLMTIGPVCNNSEEIRPYFRLTKELFNNVRRMHLENVEMNYLSMGMSDSYKIAIEEGANIVRIGTLIFGPRLK
jgi:pyridoxal phosphate enzyme (YggS family)